MFTHPSALSGMAVLNGNAIGAICCRLESLEGRVIGNPNSIPIQTPASQTYVAATPIYRVYIMTLGVLTEYRRLHVGSLLLNHIISYCRTNKTIVRICLHVHISNEGG